MYIVSEHSQTLGWKMTVFTKRQQEIINTAIELIAEKGIQELTIKNLSKKIGIAESAIYRHFNSKLDILLGILSLFRHSEDQMNRELTGLQTTPTEKLKQMLLRRFDYFSRNHAIASVILAEELFRNDRRLSSQIYEIMQSNQQIIIDLIKSGQKRGEFRNDVSAEQMAFMITGALRLIVMHWRLSEFKSDLIEEGEKLWETVETIITVKNELK